MHVCMHANIYACIALRHVRTYACVHVCMHICIYACVPVRMHVCVERFLSFSSNVYVFVFVKRFFGFRAIAIPRRKQNKKKRSQAFPGPTKCSSGTGASQCTGA